jgi:radical SAM modification target selenobiotic family peptide
MDKKDLKKILAGISVAGLLTGVSIGCTTQPQQQAPAGKETQKETPAATQETPVPAKEVPAPGG